MSGRRRKITAETIDTVVEALRNGSDMAGAAKLIGCTRQALYLHMKKHPQTAKRFDDARAAADAKVVQTLYEQAIGGNVTAMIFWLKNRQPREWRDRHELGGNNGGPIKIEIVREDMDGDGGATDPHRDGGDP